MEHQALKPHPRGSPGSETSLPAGPAHRPEGCGLSALVAAPALRTLGRLLDESRTFLLKTHVWAGG